MWRAVLTSGCSCWQLAVEVQPGQCKRLVITSIPYIREGILDFHIPVDGGVPVWYKEPVKLEYHDEPHYNYDLRVGDLIVTAQVRAPPEVIVRDASA